MNMARKVITLDFKILCNNRKADQEAENVVLTEKQTQEVYNYLLLWSRTVMWKSRGKEIAGAPAHVRAGVFRPLYAAPAGGHYSKQLRGKNNMQNGYPLRAYPVMYLRPRNGLSAAYSVTLPSKNATRTYWYDENKSRYN